MQFSTSLSVLLTLFGFRCMAIDTPPATSARVDVYYGNVTKAIDASTTGLCCFEPLRFLYNQAFQKPQAYEKNFVVAATGEESTFQAENLSQAMALRSFYSLSTMSQTLKLVEHSYQPNTQPLTAWTPFFKSIQNLDTLHLQYYLSSAYLTFLAENLDIKNLRMLSFEDAQLEEWNATSVNALFNFISRHNNVETLDLSFLTYDEPLLDLGELPEFPNLINLTISAEQVYNDDYLYALSRFLAKTPRLQSLCIKSGFFFTFTAMQSVTAALERYCPHLNAFTVELGIKSSIAILTQVLSGCPHITKLHVKGNSALAPDAAFDLFIEQLEKSTVEDIKFSLFKIEPSDTYNKGVVAFLNALAKAGTVKNVDTEFAIVAPGNEHNASPEAKALSYFVQARGSFLQSLSLGYTAMNAFDGEALAKSCVSRTSPLLLNWQTDVFGNVVLPALASFVSEKKIILNGTYKPHL